uniref:NADH dehydrogenase [ubiquinone] 1 alpha subcomplex subunit 2 n=4 Tax=Equus TaxID=9789 RepID=A0A9L0S517_HORSE
MALAKPVSAPLRHQPIAESGGSAIGPTGEVGRKGGGGVWVSAEMAAAAASRGLRANLGLREIRIHLCQRSPGSQGVRDFIEKRYVELKKANPDLPILIRECSDVQPKLWARYVTGCFVSRVTSVEAGPGLQKDRGLSFWNSEQASDRGEEMLVNSRQCRAFQITGGQCWSR